VGIANPLLRTFAATRRRTERLHLPLVAAPIIHQIMLPDTQNPHRLEETRTADRELLKDFVRVVVGDFNLY
jgi:hypothetical protein